MTHDEEDSMSELYQSLSHPKWDCKYHVVFVPKQRRKAIFGQVRRQLGLAARGWSFDEASLV
jgi:REP element-mobilizing transposase RayT